MSTLTSSQTVGPFFKFALNHESWNDLTANGPPGERIRIVGRVLDGDGAGVPDAMLEIWQADASGSYAPSSAFRGFGRANTDGDGRFEFVTVRPGAVAGPGPGSTQAPHIALTVFARGLLHHLITRVYFGDRPDDNARDPVLTSIEDPTARATLIAPREPSSGEAVPGEPPVFRFDVILQGERETAFFDV
jgi:protocatechuate 3,4-dioxygenase alpha subunit